MTTRRLSAPYRSPPVIPGRAADLLRALVIRHVEQPMSEERIKGAAHASALRVLLQVLSLLTVSNLFTLGVRLFLYPEFRTVGWVLSLLASAVVGTAVLSAIGYFLARTYYRAKLRRIAASPADVLLARYADSIRPSFEDRFNHDDALVAKAASRSDHLPAHRQADAGRAFQVMRRLKAMHGHCLAQLAALKQMLDRYALADAGERAVLLVQIETVCSGLDGSAGSLDRATDAIDRLQETSMSVEDLIGHAELVCAKLPPLERVETGPLVEAAAEAESEEGRDALEAPASLRAGQRGSSGEG